MPTSGRKKIAAFIVLGSCLVALAVALNIGWVLLNWREGLLLVLGIIFFLVIISGLVLNTIFLVREVRRNEQHDTFINAVTHELKTPLASIRLYLETLQRRDLDPEKRQEFYRVMHEDSDRLLRLVEQVLHSARTPRQGLVHRMPVDMRQLLREILDVARSRHHLTDDAIEYRDTLPEGAPATVLGDPEELKVAVSNLIDNAIKYLGPEVHVALELASADSKRLAIRVRDTGIGISAPRVEAHLPPLLSHPGHRGDARQRDRARPVHRPLRRTQTRWTRGGRERRPGPRQHVHALASDAPDV